MILKKTLKIFLIIFLSISSKLEDEFDLSKSSLTEEQIKIIEHLRTVDDHAMYELDNELKMAKDLDKRLDEALENVDGEEDFLKVGDEL